MGGGLAIVGKCTSWPVAVSSDDCSERSDIRLGSKIDSALCNDDDDGADGDDDDDDDDLGLGWGGVTLRVSLMVSALIVSLSSS